MIGRSKIQRATQGEVTPDGRPATIVHLYVFSLVFSSVFFLICILTELNENIKCY